MNVKAAVSRASQNWLYRYVTRRLPDDVVFMNWGFEEDPPMAIPLDAGDEADRYSIQLYHATATQTGGLSGKRVLEVGCGRGGGASYLARTQQPASYVGVDLNASGIEFCRRRHHVPGLSFVTGDAEALPFHAESFDAVVNVESSHCYPHFDRFLAEVARMLRPGGVFLYADVRRVAECEAWDAAMAAAPGLQVASRRDISAETLRGMELNTPRMWQVADRLAPPLLRRFARRGVPAKGSAIWDAVANGDVVYRMYRLTNAGSPE